MRYRGRISCSRSWGRRMSYRGCMSRSRSWGRRMSYRGRISRSRSWSWRERRAGRECRCGSRRGGRGYAVPPEGVSRLCGNFLSAQRKHAVHVAPAVSDGGVDVCCRGGDGILDQRPEVSPVIWISALNLIAGHGFGVFGWRVPSEEHSAIRAHERQISWCGSGCSCRCGCSGSGCRWRECSGGSGCRCGRGSGRRCKRGRVSGSRSRGECGGSSRCRCGRGRVSGSRGRCERSGSGDSWCECSGSRCGRRWRGSRGTVVSQEDVIRHCGLFFSTHRPHAVHIARSMADRSVGVCGVSAAGISDPDSKEPVPVRISA